MSSPTSSVLSLPLSPDFGDEAASKAMEELRKKVSGVLSLGVTEEVLTQSTQLYVSEAALAAKPRTAAGIGEERVQSNVAENDEEAKRRGQQNATRRQADRRGPSDA
ncbi:hypothetical protein FOMPIDRAFT_1025261 [Fomitopsis schrenkii]|uniref:Uncharacterized protein n=1 Tax=Fomitopsis schrenkii TaxID=2126942 RepID=S8F4Y8_FOMSC|nr:hypothetical protein FOMPIDRAFT_1025261 [Fomitopsis schrenkii]